MLAFQVDTSRKLSSDDDFVFFNQPSSPEGSVGLSPTQSLSIDPRLVPAYASAIVVAIASDCALSALAGFDRKL
ncbi:TerD family protein [Rhodococcus sp. ARC_M12]|uniref:TerD family protein n=1 Tax=Rhodococcus sp. ARC_M12 TaxID=2928854 RepID=UPI0035B3BBFB